MTASAESASTTARTRRSRPYYAAELIDNFFAVSCEVFFEPALKRNIDYYDQLKAFRVDPEMGRLFELIFGARMGGQRRPSSFLLKCHRIRAKWPKRLSRRN